jgi:hypothetical protein
MLTTDSRRDAADRDLFYEPALHFGIRKPAGWRFFRPSRPSARPLPRGCAESDWRRGARLPFVAMVQDIASTRQPRPTIQVCCRRAAQPTTWDLHQLLESQLTFLRRELADFERLACSFDNIIGGRRAAHVQFRYTLELPCEGGACATPVLAHNYLVPTPHGAFTVAMSSSTDTLYYDESDFAMALASVRIGSRDASVPGPTLDRSRVVGLTGPRRSRPASS